MLLVLKVRKVLTRVFSEMRWYTIVLALLFYALSTWILLYVSGEDALLNVNDFIYWLVVTGSTVGYGDMSPVTSAGKYIVSFYVIPLGLSIFALVLGRVAAWVSMQWQRGVKGLKPLDLENHVLVIGWNGHRTIQLLNLLLKERAETENKPEIVLCVKADIDNPMPDKIEFIKVISFNNDKEMDRACVDKAAVIVMDNEEDDVTMTTSLYCSKRNENAHLLAYFKDESLVDLLQTHCPNVECTPSVAVEMLAKSAFDPGSSLLQHDLLTVQEGQAQFSMEVPDSVQNLSVEKLFVVLKQKYNATFIGFVEPSIPAKVTLNPDFNVAILPKYKLFYIAEQRIRALDWQLFTE
ncbi:MULTISPECIES: potassium channel family protein [Aliiglaciecola]|uniref:potassium channel family protein n=1 Tax=Aliiglaciecola TaxID=1406885 RepID=UPI001C07FEA7|nr:MULTISPECIES: potassium channel family protein [Aliiglaciecola]MBU2879752.1 potassium channel family protein [Aliiglaciecola lipolytica]MDO6709969.1 potassium channel family protein [Aliiglaciecola sp. 2_MG-2023]MDO6751117.1 potassium channel family protein [Aliiglaciecola sp. 1_MG-2023]